MGRRADGTNESFRPARACARIGCENPVKKRTAKYCSVRCCSIDPERHERLRIQTRRAKGASVIPMARQLSWDLAFSPRNPEALLAECEGREDVPAGMSRFAG